MGTRRKEERKGKSLAGRRKLAKAERRVARKHWSLAGGIGRQGWAGREEAENWRSRLGVRENYQTGRKKMNSMWQKEQLIN